MGTLQTIIFNLLKIGFIIVLSGCYLNSKLRSLTEVSETEKPVVDDPHLEPILKLNYPQVSVPEGYPYFALVSIENNPGGQTFELVDSTCEGLAVHPTTGVLSGDIGQTDGESCVYKVRANVGMTTLTSEEITVSSTTSLNFTFSNNRLVIKKGQGSVSSSLILSSPAPFDSYVKYDLYSLNYFTDVVTLNEIFPSNQNGFVFIPSGATSVPIYLEVPTSSSLVGVEIQTVRLETGAKENRPQLQLILHENTTPDFVQIESGNNFNCSISSSGNLFCWGQDNYGQIGNGAGSVAEIVFPQQIGTLSNWQDIELGMSHVCGIESGRLFCWGRDNRGQIGNGSGSSSDVTSPAQIGVSTSWQWIAAGASHTCGIDGGKLYCWGQDANGQVGNGSGANTDVTDPQQIGASTTWESVSLGANHSCGIDAGKLFCWGFDSSGEVGNGSGTSSDVTAPVQIGASTTWESVSLGASHSCGIDSGMLYCWGQDTFGQIGNSATGAALTSPSQVGTETSWQLISMGGAHSCGIESGKLYCWGSGGWGQLGNGAASNVDTPVQIGTSNNWLAVSGYTSHSCGIDAGKLYCWGFDANGCLGLGTGSVASVYSPEQVGQGTNWQKISAASLHSCGIENGKLFCWGTDGSANLGNGSASNSDKTVPDRVGFSSSWNDISGGNSYTCGIDSGKLYCWGYETYGQLGNGTQTGYVYSPQQIGVSTTWQMVRSRERTTCGIDSGKLYCWGNDLFGQNGNGSVITSQIVTPEQIGTSTTWQKLSIGDFHNCAIDAGKLFCWGRDVEGQIGNGSGSTATVHAPEQIGVSTTWQDIALGSTHTCGIDAGKLFCWGSDTNEALGNGSGVSPATSPTQIGISTTWQSVSAYANHTCGIDSGKLYCWGNHLFGQAGLGASAATSISSPTQVGSSTTWQSISAGGSHTCGIDSGHALCWGQDRYGQSARSLGVQFLTPFPVISF